MDSGGRRSGSAFLCGEWVSLTRPKPQKLISSLVSPLASLLKPLKAGRDINWKSSKKGRGRAWFGDVFCQIDCFGGAFRSAEVGERSVVGA